MRRLQTAAGFLGGWISFSGFAVALDIEGVQPAALDQPRINALLSRGPVGSGTLLVADLGGGFETFNIQAFFDTGASGILLSSNTADLLGVTRHTHNGELVVFSDVGVAGTDSFNVSEQLHIGLARYHSEAAVDDQQDLSEYNQVFANVRTQIGPIGVEPDPILGDLDVFGVPLMQGKVIVMDPKPVNTFLDTMRTYVYNPGTPFNPAAADTEPGIPQLDDSNSYHIRLSKGDFSPYTQVTPTGAEGPTLNGNPFIGPDPTKPAQAGDPPPVTMSYGTGTTSGSFLLDTGAAASMISSAKAAAVGVTYDPNAPDDAPVLLHGGSPIPDQFTLTIGGIGGTTKVAGFFLDTMTLPTVEGATDGNRNLSFLGAPVLVADITVKDPLSNGTLTLDGIFGMNYLVASAFLLEAEPFPIIDALTPGAFDWIVYDDPNSMLSLRIGESTGFVYKTWMGWGGTTWDIDNTNAWFLQSPYSDGDAVKFTDLIYDNSADTVYIAEPVAPAHVLFENSVESEGGVHYVLHGAPIVGATELTKTGNGIVTLQNQNTYQGLTDIQNGTLELQAQQNIGPVVVREQGNLVMETSQTFHGLNVAGGAARLTAGGSKLLLIGELIISGAGQLDLTDNEMILHKSETPLSDQLEDIRDAMQAGYNNGAWNGPGIMSSIAANSAMLDGIGFADNAVLGRSSFAGASVTADDILFLYTYAGDANLDGKVDVGDLGALASEWQQPAIWTGGDFNYDGVVNVADLGILATNWQKGITAPLPPGPSLSEALASLGLPNVSVPEPGASALLALTGLLARRRRDRSAIDADETGSA